LRIVSLIGREKSLHRVVARDEEAGEVGQELTAKVKDDHEEVEDNKADDSVGLGDRRLALEVVEGGVLGQLRATEHQHRTTVAQHHQKRHCEGLPVTHLAIELPDVVLNAILGVRHGGACSF
jgi:hypothetical protein